MGKREWLLLVFGWVCELVWDGYVDVLDMNQAFFLHLTAVLSFNRLIPHVVFEARKKSDPMLCVCCEGLLGWKDLLIEIIEMVKHTTNYDEKRHDLSRGITRFLIQDYKIRFWEHAFGGWRTILCHGVKYAKKRGFSDRFTTCFLESPTVLFGLWISMNAIYPSEKLVIELVLKVLALIWWPHYLAAAAKKRDGSLGFNFVFAVVLVISF